MKKIGVMTDIHNNAVALEAVLNVFDAESAPFPSKQLIRSCAFRV